MEIMDLEVCDFIQYKPECITWPAPREFTVVTVERERDWFEHNLPIMRDFWTKVLWHREHGTEGLTKVRKKRAVSPKAAPPTLVPEVCEV
jgi:hypothetical protein